MKHPLDGAILSIEIFARWRSLRSSTRWRRQKRRIRWMALWCQLKYSLDGALRVFAMVMSNEAFAR